MTRRLGVLLAVAALALAGCGGTSARDDADEATASLDRIRAGTLSMSLLVTPRGNLGRRPFGFEVAGPFSFGRVPTARIEYTQIANGSSETATLVLERDGGSTEVNGERRTLTGAQLRELRAAAEAGQGSASGIGDMVESAERCGEGCVEGDLDIVRAVEAVLGMTGAPTTLDEDARTALEDAKRSATYRLHWVGDHVLRDLTATVDLGFRPSPRLRAALGDLVGAKVEVELAVAGARVEP